MAESAVPIQVIEGRLQQIEQVIRELQVERNMLLRLRGQAIEVKPATGRRPKTVETEDGALPGPSEAVVSLLAQHPGLKTEEIADKLADKIATKSDNPRRVVVNTVTNLANRKRIKSDASGGWVVAG